MAVKSKDLWGLTVGKPQVDATELAAAIAEQAGKPDLDFRTRLLIRDGLAALKKFWGETRLNAWLAASGRREFIEAICREDLGPAGFLTLPERIMDKTDPEDIRQFLRELGLQIAKPVNLMIGGSAALILPGHLARATDDIDIVDEVPAEVRILHTQLDQLRKRYGLRLAHFQGHYLPSGWQERLHSQGSYGRLQVFLVDVYDIFLSKLFSSRPKDLDDLRMLLPQLARDKILRLLEEAATALLADATFREKAERNWYVLCGDSLPPAKDQGPRPQS